MVTPTASPLFCFASHHLSVSICLRGTICFTICLFISPDLDGYRAPGGNEPYNFRHLILGTGISDHRVQSTADPQKPRRKREGRKSTEKRGSRGPSAHETRRGGRHGSIRRGGWTGRQAGVLCRGGALFPASITFAEPAVYVCRQGAANKDRGRDRGVGIAAEEARWSASEGPGVIGAGREGVLGASGGRERDSLGGGWLL